MDNSCRPIVSRFSAFVALACILLAPGVSAVFAGNENGSFDEPQTSREPASATPAEDPAIRLSTFPGQNQPQSAMGRTVGTLCPRLAALRPGGLTSGERDLLNVCSAIIAAPDSAAAAAIAALTPEQASAPRRVAGTQTANLVARLQALRAGAAGQGGISISGLSLLGQPVFGGAAGADDYEFERLAFFANGNLDWGSKDPSTNEYGFDYRTWRVTAGADYVFTDGLVAGLALGYSGSEADFDTGSGDMDVSNTYLSAYGTWFPTDAFYVEGSAEYGWSSYDQTRNISYGLFGARREAQADFDGNQLDLMLGAGYDIVSGRHIVDLYGRLSYSSVDIDAYTEHGASGLDLRIRSQSSTSLVSILGAAYQTSISTRRAVFVPQAWLEWAHEFGDGDQPITGTFANDPNQIPFVLATDRFDSDYFRLGAGLGAQLAKGYTAFVSYEATFGLRDYREHSATAGIRIAF